MSDLEKRINRIRAKLKNATPKGPDKRILLGRSFGQPIYLDNLDTSIHIMGATREGKSKQLENIFRQFITKGIGGAVIDPHGYLYDDLVAYCSYQSSRQPKIKDKIVLFDPEDDEYIIGFNTLQQLEHDLETLTLSRMYATIKARGKDDFDEMPTAKTWLYNIYYPLIKKGLTLIEARHLIDRAAKNNPIAREIIRDTGIDLIEHDWLWYEDQPKKVQYEELLSSINLLRNFVTSKRMELILGRRNRVLNLRKIMDEGKVIIINLSSRKLHQDIARLLGTLLVNEFFLAAKTRPKDSRPFFLAIDEFENYVTQDVADILDQGAKFGLHMILAHHSLEQLKEQNKRVYSSVLENAKIKIIFGGLTYENSEIMVKELYSYAGKGGIDPRKIKRTQKSPYIEPKESTRTVKTSGSSETESSGRVTQSGSTAQAGETYIPVDTIFASDELASYMESNASSFSEATSEGRSTSYSYTEALVPFIEQKLKWYVSNIQYRPLEEQIYDLIAKMKNLPQQICLLKLPKQPVITLKSEYVETHHLLEGELKDFAKELAERSPYHMLRDDAVKERKLITDQLESGKETKKPATQDEDDDRWEKT